MIEAVLLLCFGLMGSNLLQHECRPLVRADRAKLKVHASLVFLFFAGGIAGAVGFRFAGFGATIFLALVLLVAAALPFFDDVKTTLNKTLAR